MTKLLKTTTCFSLFFAAILAGSTAYGFEEPSKSPTATDSSSDSLVNQMAGSTFDSGTDSLEAISDKLDMPSGGVQVLQPTEFISHTVSGSPTTFVGHEMIRTKSYSGSALNSPLGEVTDIDDPDNTGGWTTMDSISGGPFACSITSTLLLKISASESESAGDSLRAQILVDGTVMWDAKVVDNNTSSMQHEEAYWIPNVPFLVQDSLVIKAARVGSFTYSSSYFYLPGIYCHTINQ